jgi:hypothetical protein
VFRWNLQHQNPADVKWFAEIDPESMDITGTALLALGPRHSRYLRVAFGAVANDQDGDDQQQQRQLASRL